MLKVFMFRSLQNGGCIPYTQPIAANYYRLLGYLVPKTHNIGFSIALTFSR
jgi:hypothetical protein